MGKRPLIAKGEQLPRTDMSDFDGKVCKFIPVNDLRVGDLTALGVVSKEPKFSASRKTVVVTVETHAGKVFTDRRSARAKIAVWRAENR